jgi:hypothetical protein
MPRDKKGVQRYLGMIGFYRAYIKNFSKMAAPITKLLRDGERFGWSTDQERAFRQLNEALTADTCLALPDMDKEFVIQCDASIEGLGAVLAQEGELGLRPVAFASRQLNIHEKKYCISELEMLSAVWAVKKFLPYVEYSHFTIESDHKSLKSMLHSEGQNGRVLRWSMRLSGLDCEVKYRRGTCNLVADALP